MALTSQRHTATKLAPRHAHNTCSCRHRAFGRCGNRTAGSSNPLSEACAAPETRRSFITLRWQAGASIFTRCSPQTARSSAHSLNPSPRSRPNPACTVELVQGLGRADHMDWMIQKTTELGVTRKLPCSMLNAPRHRSNRRNRKRKCSTGAVSPSVPASKAVVQSFPTSPFCATSSKPLRHQPETASCCSISVATR